jgi:RNA polymerase primary sigma factor
MSFHNDEDDQDVSLMAYDQYMRQVRWTPRLADGEEERLLQYIECGKVERTKPQPDAHILARAQSACDRLVACYQPLVISIARKWQHRFRSMELVDLFQEGNLGLLEAIERNDPRANYRLATLASRCIHSALWQAWAYKDGMVRLPQKMRQTLSRLRQVKRQLELVLGREPSLGEIAREMAMEREKLQEVLDWERQGQVMSLHAFLAQDEEAEDTHDFVSLFAALVVAESSRRAALEQLVQEAMEKALTARQREIVEVRFGLRDGVCLSLKEAARELGICQGPLATTETRAKARLREVLAPVLAVAEAELVA